MPRILPLPIYGVAHILEDFKTVRTPDYGTTVVVALLSPQAPLTGLNPLVVNTCWFCAYIWYSCWALLLLGNLVPLLCILLNRSTNSKQIQHIILLKILTLVDAITRSWFWLTCSLDLFYRLLLYFVLIHWSYYSWLVLLHNNWSFVFEACIEWILLISSLSPSSVSLRVHELIDINICNNFWPSIIASIDRFCILVYWLLVREIIVLVVTLFVSISYSYFEGISTVGVIIKYWWVFIKLSEIKS